MTKTIITSYATFLCIAIAMAGITTAHASEVTGTLSSNAANNTTSGDISGTVTGGGSSSGGSSSRGSGGGGGSSNRPSGAVLGATTLNAAAPSFPNAGVQPEEVPHRVTVWSIVVTFLRNIITF